MTEKIAVVAPIPSARVRIAAAAKPGARLQAAQRESDVGEKSLPRTSSGPGGTASASAGIDARDARRFRGTRERGYTVPAGSSGRRIGRSRSPGARR